MRTANYDDIHNMRVLDDWADKLRTGEMIRCDDGSLYIVVNTEHFSCNTCDCHAGSGDYLSKCIKGASLVCPLAHNQSYRLVENVLEDL